jgi:hypothetical protein
MAESRKACKECIQYPTLKAFLNGQDFCHCTQCHAPSHCRPDTCTTLHKEKPKEMLNVSERSLVNVYCFSLFFGENVGQAKEMPMDLTMSSHDRTHVANV